MMKLKAIIFDFDQTLVNSAEGFRTAEHWLQAGIFDFLDLSDWDEFIGVYRQIRGKGPADTPEDKCRQWEAVCQHFGGKADPTTLLSWQEGYWDRVEQGSTLFPETLLVLKDLHEHFKIGLLTNASAPPGKSHRLDLFPELIGLFDQIIICGRSGIPMKPHPDGFRKLLTGMEVLADEAIFVGDDLETDVRGATEAGIIPVWLDHRLLRRKRRGSAPANLSQIDTLQALTSLDSADTVITAQKKLCSSSGITGESSPRGGLNP